MSASAFPELLLDWYSQNARNLPWRIDSDPYRIWVSEIMLQQTRVDTVIPYFQRWMERFPTLADLADASQQEVLGLWEGLGYYSRARNLHKAAQIVMKNYSGVLPGDIQALSRLPGVGRYTAGAIASLAFGLDAPALDGNIRRVLARLFDVELPAGSPEGQKRLWELALQHLPHGKSADYNQGLMDLGSQVCTPRLPKCLECPLQEICEANARGLQQARPVRQPKTSPPHFIVTAAVIQRRGQVLIAQRPAAGLLGGLWEFPGGKLQPGEDLEACLRREICEELDAEVLVGEKLGVFKHAYTHFRITLHAFHCRLENGKEPRPLEAQDLIWVHPKQLAGYPMGKIDRLIANQLFACGVDHPAGRLHIQKEQARAAQNLDRENLC